MAEFLAFLKDHIWELLGALGAVIAGGLAIRLILNRVGKRANLVDQSGANAKGDIVGRDKITSTSEPQSTKPN